MFKDLWFDWNIIFCFRRLKQDSLIFQACHIKLFVFVFSGKIGSQFSQSTQSCMAYSISFWWVRRLKSYLLSLSLPSAGGWWWFQIFPHFSRYSRESPNKKNCSPWKIKNVMSESWHFSNRKAVPRSGDYSIFLSSGTPCTTRLMIL